jgi:hypothetical protein
MRTDAPMSVEEETYVEETCMPDSALQANNMHLIRHWLAQHYRRDDMVVEIVDLMSECVSGPTKTLNLRVVQSDGSTPVSEHVLPCVLSSQLIDASHQDAAQ